MQCFSGIQLSSGDIVPCGQCINCRINKGRRWTGRLLLEHTFNPSVWPNADWFLTFTYAPEHVPVAPESGELTLRKKAFLKWINNCQRDLGKLRYLAVGEYGDKGSRPHYHAIVFNQPEEQILELSERWHRYGFTQHAPFTRERASYITGYTVKKLNGDRQAIAAQKGVEPEFRTSSRIPPIGSPCLPVLLHQYRSRAGKHVLARNGDVARTFRFSGKIYPFDPYILRKLRGALDIPQTHAGRIDACETYLQYHNDEAAQICPIEAHAARTRYVAKEKVKRSITPRL